MEIIELWIWVTYGFGLPSFAVYLIVVSDNDWRRQPKVLTKAHLKRSLMCLLCAPVSALYFIGLSLLWLARRYKELED